MYDSFVFIEQHAASRIKTAVSKSGSEAIDRELNEHLMKNSKMFKNDSEKSAKIRRMFVSALNKAASLF